MVDGLRSRQERQGADDNTQSSMTDVMTTLLCSCQIQCEEIAKEQQEYREQLRLD